MDFSIEKYYFQNKYDNYDWRWITEPFDRKVFTWFAHIKFLDVVIIDNRPFSEDIVALVRRLLDGISPTVNSD